MLYRPIEPASILTAAARRVLGAARRAGWWLYQRHQFAEDARRLHELDDHLLADVGVPRDQIDVRVKRPRRQRDNPGTEQPTHRPAGAGSNAVRGPTEQETA